MDRTIAEHAAIVDALEQRNLDLACAWMTVHVASVEAWVERAALDAARHSQPSP